MFGYDVFDCYKLCPLNSLGDSQNISRVLKSIESRTNKIGKNISKFKYMFKKTFSELVQN